jgi:hypothetical protein
MQTGYPMANNCSKNLYTVSFTDKDKDDIFVSKGELITDRADIAFVGKTKRDYGEIFNENILHLLENFACPEDELNPGNPELAVAFGALLENPVEGQVWFNTTQDRPFRYNGTVWIPLGTGCDVAGNYGVIAHGQQLPHPVCPVTGYVFQYDECSWVVSPFAYEADINYMLCLTDENAVVTMQYRPVGGLMTSGMVNYQIIGIRGNANLGTLLPLPSVPDAATPTPTPTIEATATVTPTMTVTPNSSEPVTPTPTPTGTPSVTATPSGTPSPGVSVTPTDTPHVTPTRAPTSTPVGTPNPTQTSTPDVTPTPEVTSTPAVTVTPPVTVTPEITPSPSYDPTGEVNSGGFSCHRADAPACISFNNTGTVSSAGCNASGTWLEGGFRPGEDGYDYTYTITVTGESPPNASQYVSGAFSGNFGFGKTWCLSVPPSTPERLVNMTVNISGPNGNGSITMNLFTVNSSF